MENKKPLTKSQKLRYFIRLNWIADESELSDEEYYNEKMDKFINVSKEALLKKENFMQEMKSLAEDVS